MTLQVACDLLVLFGLEAMQTFFYLFAREYLRVSHLFHCILLREEGTADGAHVFYYKIRQARQQTPSKQAWQQDVLVNEMI